MPASSAPYDHAMSSAFDPQRFIELALANHVLQFGDFVLKSGRVSPYFFNAGRLADAQMLTQLATGYAQTLIQQCPELNDDNAAAPMLFGAAYKGIPLVAATAQALWQQHHINMQWGYNRKEVKTHGEGGQLVGTAVAGKSVWLIDDVITAGTAMREVVALLEAQDARVAGVLVALDRKERGEQQHSAIQELAEQLNVPVLALFDIDDIIAYLTHQNEHTHCQRMQHYRQRYGVD